MATSPSTSNTPTGAAPPIVTWSGTHIVIEPSFERDTVWWGTPYGDVMQPSGPGVRGIVPAPGSLYGDAQGKQMFMETGGEMTPVLPPSQKIYERSFSKGGLLQVSQVRTPANP